MSFINSDIKEAIKDNNLVFFIGSGFSVSLGFPNWNELVKVIINKLSIDKFRPFIELLDNNTMQAIQVLEFIKDNRKEILDTLESTFKIDKEKEKKLKEQSKFKKLWEISGKIITTNYDKALENSDEEITIDGTTVFNFENKVSKLHSSDKYLLKLHGCINNSANCILLEDDYKKLYNEDTLVKFEFEKIVSEKTIVFIGFSMADPYVNYIFESIKNLYGGLNKTHYIITTNNTDFSDYGVIPITIPTWNEIDQVLDEMIEEKKQYNHKDVKEDKLTIVEEVINKKVRIGVFKATPIEKDYNFEEQIKEIQNIKAEIEILHLNIENIRNCNDYDYLFILTKTIKGKIVIEGEYLNSEYITLKELEENLCNEKIKGIFILSDINEEFKEEDKLLKSYIILRNMNKKELGNIFFKFFRKKDKSVINEKNLKLINGDSLELIELNAEKIILSNKKSKLSEKIDVKNLCNFTGRKSDLEQLSKKILELKNNNKILTIKGAGGLGKTTIIKKVSIEFSKRNIFKDGIYFVDCEFIKDCTEFQREIARCFYLEQEINFIKYLEENELVKDMMVILDNFETLIYNEELENIKELISFISNYVTIVITSRELLDLEYEDYYEIRNLTTDEAEELFQKETLKVFHGKEKDIIRTDILERILGNNPLAIKLIAKNISSSVNIEKLKESLSKDLFSITDDEELEVYKNSSDRNIERRKSLYATINYSYKNLSEKEKFIFEILSLFPDGIYEENLSRLIKYSKSEKEGKEIDISYKEINKLEKKSLIENNNGNIKLQSIVGRFAEKCLFKRENIEEYYKQAFYYNNFIIEEILEIEKDDNSLSLKIFEKIERNFIKSIMYIKRFECNKESKIEYIDAISWKYIAINQCHYLIKEIEKVKEYFSDTKNNKIAIESIAINLEYFDGNFDIAFEKLKKIIPFSLISEYDYRNKINDIIINNSTNIYSMEGYNFQTSKYFAKRKYNIILKYPEFLFKIGEYSEKLKENVRHKDFFYYEMEFNCGLLKESVIEKYINNLYDKEHIEKMQANYIKAKMGIMTKKELSKLVVVNPYTEGLKFLMYAFLEKDIDKAMQLYKAAISRLEHIKYYYVEAIYYYSKFLKENNLVDEYEEYSNKGYDLAKKFSYRYLVHIFKCLIEDIEEKYNKKNYPLPDNYSFDDYIDWLIKEREKNK